MFKSMRVRKVFSQAILCCILSVGFVSTLTAQKQNPKFKVIAFYTAENDRAHISFVHEANKWFSKMADDYHFTYDSTKNWANLNAKFLAQYQVVLFLDTRPED